ncbi:hypothetical protein V7S43_014813 [Phytophthora oleae]|uniref:Uncharacterized protein n=1 Tax=Phytophthora oleae TaxID=2107226 RepID=A0ABD3F1Y2_9STRA
MTLQRSPRSTAERRREREMQFELLKFHRDQTDPISTNITKKRVREPRVEVETNPFCAERQLADSYQQLNFNKVQLLISNEIKSDVPLSDYLLLGLPLQHRILASIRYPYRTARARPRTLETILA